MTKLTIMLNNRAVAHRLSRRKSPRLLERLGERGARRGRLYPLAQLRNFGLALATGGTDRCA